MKPLLIKPKKHYNYKSVQQGNSFDIRFIGKKLSIEEKVDIILKRIDLVRFQRILLNCSLMSDRRVIGLDIITKQLKECLSQVYYYEDFNGQYVFEFFTLNLTNGVLTIYPKINI